MSKPNPVREELRSSLSRLHSELSATPRVDAASKQLLRDVLADIERLLGASGLPSAVPPAAGPAATSPTAAGPAAGGSPAADPGLAVPARQGGSIENAPQRLEELAVEFDARYPGLAGTLRQFIILLDRAGL